MRIRLRLNGESLSGRPDTDQFNTSYDLIALKARKTTAEFDISHLVPKPASFIVLGILAFED